MAKIDDIYEAVDDFGLITSAEAAELGMSGAEMVQQEKLGKLVRVARGYITTEEEERIKEEITR